MRWVASTRFASASRQRVVGAQLYVASNPAKHRHQKTPDQDFQATDRGRKALYRYALPCHTVQGAQRPRTLMSGVLNCPNFKLALSPLIRCLDFVRHLHAPPQYSGLSAPTPPSREESLERMTGHANRQALPLQIDLHIRHRSHICQNHFKSQGCTGPNPVLSPPCLPTSWASTDSIRFVTNNFSPGSITIHRRFGSVFATPVDRVRPSML